MKPRILRTLYVLCLVLAVTVAAVLAAPMQAADTGMTRLQFVEELARASGDDLEGSGVYPADFADVPDSAALDWAYSKRLINGDGDGNFRPGDDITRQEAAMILSRYLDYRYTSLPLEDSIPDGPDVFDAADWAKGAIRRCCFYQVIAQKAGDAFRSRDKLLPADGAQWIAAAQTVQMTALVSTENPGFADALTAAAAPESGNYLFSPYSARLCLAMLAQGADGDTRKELLSALQIDDLSQFSQDVQTQLARYDGLSRVMTLDTANSVWLNQSRFAGTGAFAPAYVSLLSERYGATAEEVTNADSVERVNRWASEQTRGKIPAILDESNRNFATAVVNAVYFKAAWKEEFSPSRTSPAPFTNEDGSTTQVDFLHGTVEAGYYHTPGVEALKLDFANFTYDDSGFERFPDADFSMYFILGWDNLQLEALFQQAEFETGPVAVTIPKFKLEYSSTLDSALQSLGVSTAYSAADADFSPMVVSQPADGNLYLDTVLQKTYLAIDEQGAEAAAVTAALDTATAAEPEQPPLVRTFTADRPFYIAIRDNTSGTLLFVGRYAQAK